MIELNNNKYWQKILIQAYDFYCKEQRFAFDTTRLGNLK